MVDIASWSMHLKFSADSTSKFLTEYSGQLLPVGQHWYVNESNL